MLWKMYTFRCMKYASGLQSENAGVSFQSLGFVKAPRVESCDM